MLTREDLSAIAKLFEHRFMSIESSLTSIKKDIRIIKKDIRVMVAAFDRVDVEMGSRIT